MIKELIKNNRSYRRFYQEREIKREVLLDLVDSAACSASAGNLQRIRYALINSKEKNALVFDSLAFAAYLKDVWSGPTPDEQPSAYIILLTEKKPDVNLAIDMGIAAQSILLTATEQGIGGCIFRSFSSEKISAVIGCDGYSPELVIALGYPSEKVVLTSVKDNDIKYYRDENDVHVVPKYSAEELVKN
jgi:nitroreductase